MSRGAIASAMTSPRRCGWGSMMAPDDLKRWQERNRYTGKRLADELGVHPMTVTYWRSGKVAIPRTVELALRYLEMLA